MYKKGVGMVYIMKRKLFAVFCLLLLFCMLISGCINNGDSDAPPDKDGIQTEDYIAWKAYFINVGKADSILLNVLDKYYLIDTGTKKSFDKITEVLEELKVTSLEGVFLTHTHKDHIGGLEKLLKNQQLKIKELYAPKITSYKDNGKNAVDEIAEDAGRKVVRLQKGDEVKISEDIKFTVFGPVEYDAEEDNNNSLVMKLNGKTNSVLFAADCMMAQEASLLSSDIKSELKSDVLKVAHHGNDDATSYTFAASVSPQISVISTNSEEKPDTPAGAVMFNLMQTGSEIFVTQDYVRYVLIESSGGELAVAGR